MDGSLVNIQIAFGACNLQRSGATLTCLKVEQDFTKKSAAQAGVVDPKSRSWHQATRNKDSGKGFTSQRVSFAEGTVVLMQARRTSGGSPMADGGVFIRLRNSGPLIMLGLKLPIGPEGLLGDQFQAFVGRGDILTAEELWELEYELPNDYVSHYMSREEVDELFKVSELSPAASKRPAFGKVYTSTGPKVALTAPEPVRRLRARR